MDKDVSAELCRLAYQSVARLAILPMQDILSLDESSRMNMPATSQGNWTWRVQQEALTADVREHLAGWVALFGRNPNKKQL
jgi:4-alpha-glucanotransferase